MNSSKNLAIIGSGPSAVYLLKHFLDRAEEMRKYLREIAIYEKGATAGIGMPYSPEFSDHTNMANIPSEEMPPLLSPLADWLRSLDDATLEELQIERDRISERKIYSRIALGKYLRAQYNEIVAKLAAAGIAVKEYLLCPVLDVTLAASGEFTTVLTDQGRADYRTVIIAIGHSWPREDRPDSGYFASPWPIAKLLPATNQLYNFSIGTLGASLSAFDVIAALSERHGSYVRQGADVEYRPADGAEKFKIVMHAAHGRLPHLRYGIENFERKIYQHVTSEELFALVDDRGFLRIHTYFDVVCRPALREAFQKDGLEEIVALLADKSFTLKAFVAKMSEEHSYADAFEGMRHEMVEARNSVLGDHPIFWKETIDDLIYTLNFHAELLPAEDHLLLHATVMPFLMNVIAAMPLHSADKLLALHDAGKLEMISGKVSLAEETTENNLTTIVVETEDAKEEIQYRMFVDCSGQKPLEIEDYPFPGLVAHGQVRKARARFADPNKADSLTGKSAERLDRDAAGSFYYTGGIDIDGTYGVIDTDGEVSQHIFDIAFPHSTGVRPYSYGLQSCSDTGAIVTAALLKIFASGPAETEITPDEITEIYANV